MLSRGYTALQVAVYSEQAPRSAEEREIERRFLSPLFFSRAFFFFARMSRAARRVTLRYVTGC